MSLFKQKVELIVIRDSLNPQNNIEHYQGKDLESLVKQAFPQGISDSVRFYHSDLTKEIFTLDERKDRQSINKFCATKGRVYAQVVPMGLEPISWAIIGASVAVSLAATFLLQPKIPNIGQSGTPLSPNNSLAARTNEQRLGGRVPDIVGEAWSVPDLIAAIYSVYIDGKEVEYSYMCVGRGKYDVKKALDDTTPISQVSGSGVLVYDPDANLNDEPAFVFGEHFNPDEAEFAALAVKRYTAVNGQKLQPNANYTEAAGVVFRPPNIVEFSSSVDASRFAAGRSVLIESADTLQSGNNLNHQYAQPPVVDENGDEVAGQVVQGDPITYTLDGSYEIEAIDGNRVLLLNPSQSSADWQNLADNADYTKPRDIVISTNEKGLWQGWYYTNDQNHNEAMVNIRYPRGLYMSYYKGGYNPLGVAVEIETELVDANGIPIDGTSELATHIIYGSKFSDYWVSLGGQLVDGEPSNGSPQGSYALWGADYPQDDGITDAGGKTLRLKNSHWVQGRSLRFRIRRLDSVFGSEKHKAVDELKVESFYSYRRMTVDDMPEGVTTVYTKTLATEGALSLKERKLRLLVERYVTDYYTKELKLSKRADDIIYHVATDPKIGNLTDAQVDFEQIKQEIDILVGYFGSPNFAEFCYTFDDDNLSSEETIQAIASAVFCNAKRYGNKLMLDFERKVPAPLAIFNSSNMLPDTFAISESFGVVNNFDGVKVEYTDSTDDAIITKFYPHNAVTNPHTEKLIGVRNELQATAHMMRIYNKDRYTNVTCSFEAGDESNIVSRNNCIAVADQYVASVMQGSVESIDVIDGNVVLSTYEPIYINRDATICIQTINNGVEFIKCSPRDTYSVIIARMPVGAVSTEGVVQAGYQIAVNPDNEIGLYLVQEKDPSQGFTNKLVCSNYDDRYYQNDHDYRKSIA